MGISPEEFDYVVQLAHREAAIVLEPGKEYLVESRLGDLAGTMGLQDAKGVIAQLRSGGTSARGLVSRTIEALTTNETLFFRDVHPFEALRTQVLPELIRVLEPVRRLTIWSAACSTGQEPYSLAMLIREHFPALATWDVRILATDLSQPVLNRAAQGSFSQIEVNRGLPVNYLIKYFTKVDDRWLIAEQVKKLVTFQSMNLSRPWPTMPSFDLVLLRNVMIYFDVPTKKTILDRVLKGLAPHGVLFLGSAETTMNLHNGYRLINVDKTVCYGPA